MVRTKKVKKHFRYAYINEGATIRISKGEKTFCIKDEVSTMTAEYVYNDEIE